ncbi:hypothetical protein P389DRAFT_173885 [Cystobasidium minutum MCA 4210]|uniref:uncharacterized protein n=1 Tax=Cystobasidium minutum MCA 4210 TaxID=1397322 RepID=UPI0034CD33EE|eukprot:jgi/Rhomi1/173885/fgenesh1_kg.6_\
MAPSPLAKREGIPSSISMPGLYSVSRLRREVSTTPVKRPTAVSANSTPLQPYAGAASPRETPQQSREQQRHGLKRRDSTLDPESIALPPSSTATGVSSSSAGSSPVAHQAVLPQSGKGHDRKPSRSRDAFEEGILKEMRERLAAAGLGEGASRRKEDSNDRNNNDQ